MKGITIFISLLYFILLIGIINAQNNKKEIKSTDSAESNIQADKNNSSDSKDSSLDDRDNELNRPSKAFTVVLMVYMALIIIGAVLVLVLVKPKIES